MSNCDGCRIEKRPTHCIPKQCAKIKHIKNNCPCKQCIIKIVCNNVCETFKSYINNLEKKYGNKIYSM